MHISTMSLCQVVGSLIVNICPCPHPSIYIKLFDYMHSKVLAMFYGRGRRVPIQRWNVAMILQTPVSMSHATIILSEILAEAKVGKKKLLVASLDIQKGFGFISHPHLLRKCYIAGLPGRWWIMKFNTFSNMCSRVTWKW